MLHVLNMYREPIEHPWSMPDDLKAQVDLTSGRDRGRIYRLVPSDFAPGFEIPPAPRLGSATTEQLVVELSNPNSWWRDTAHRLIFERQDAAAVPPLRLLLATETDAIARLHALWSLHGLAELTVDDLNAAINDGDARIRKHAIRLAELRLQNNSSLVNAVLQRASDDSVRVRFQVALTLGELSDDRVAATLANIAKHHRDDAWIPLAVLSSLAGSELSFLKHVVDDADFVRNSGGLQMIEKIAFVVAARKQHQQIGELYRIIMSLSLSEPDRGTVRQHVLAGLGAGLKRSGRSLESSVADADSATRNLVGDFVQHAVTRIADPAADVDDRLEALKHLQWAEFSTVSTVCTT